MVMSGDLGIEHLTELALIGRGGFSVVYSALDTRFDRRVAVKVLNPMVDEDDRRRFERECRLMGRLGSHPNVVTVYESGYTTDQRPYMVMELITGGTVADELEELGRIPWPRALSYLIPVSDVLQQAHEADIFHRDIKPENILLDATGRPLLTDFGIAYLRSNDKAASTFLAATWLHSAPETFANRRDERSDIYSLASTLYMLLSGTAPFFRPDEATIEPLLYRLANEPPPDLPADVAPPTLNQALHQALAKNPDDRPQTAADFGRSLTAIAATAPGATGSPAAPVTPSADTTVRPPDRPPEATAGPGSGSGLPPAGGANPTRPLDRAELGDGPGPAQGSIPQAGAAQDAARPDAADTLAPTLATPSDGRRRRLVLATGAIAVVAAAGIGGALALTGDDPSAPTTDAVALETTVPDPTSTTSEAATTTTAPTTSTTLGPQEIPSSGTVLAVVTLSDGRVAAATGGSTVRVFESADPDAEPVVYEVGSTVIWTMAALPDGRLAIGADNDVRIVDPNAIEAEALVLAGHSNSVLDLAVLPDGRLVSASADTTVRVWNIDDPEASADVYTGHAQAVWAVATLDDGQVVSGGGSFNVQAGGGVAAGDEGVVVQVWDPDDVAAPAAFYNAHTSTVWDLAVLPDGRVASSAEQVHIWDPAAISGAGFVYTGHAGEIFALHALDDGRVASGGSDTSVHVWDPDEPGEAPVRYDEHFAAIWSMTRLVDGRMVSAGQDATVRVWSA